MRQRTYLCKTESDTEALGRQLAPLLRAPAFVALNGDLGAGKTVLVRGLGKALGISDPIKSPTFTIVSEYASDPELLHFDAYRLSDADELYAIGFSDYLAHPAILMMEWAELVQNALPKERLEIRIAGSGGEERTLTLRAFGKRYEEVLECLV